MQETLKATDQDLQQLDAMLNHHCERLIAAFEGAIHAVDGTSATAAPNPAVVAEQIKQVRKELSGAVLHLQFQDITSQMLSHCQVRLQACQTLLEQVQLQATSLTGHLALQPLKGPVTQSSLEAGSIDLFDLPATPPSKETPNEC